MKKFRQSLPNWNMVRQSKIKKAGELSTRKKDNKTNKSVMLWMLRCTKITVVLWALHFTRR